MHAKANGVRKTKECQSTSSHPLPTKPAILGPRQTKGIFPFPLLTIRYLYMFTLRIKSSSGLESVAHSLLLLFSGASPELVCQGCLANPRTGKAAHGQNSQVKSSTAAGKLGKLLNAWPQGLRFSWTNSLSTLANTGLSCQAPAHPLSLHWDSFLYLPIRTQRGCRFLIPSFWIRPRILLTR